MFYPETMIWKLPPKIKIYEALGSIADGRVHINGDTAKVYSSSGNKYYEVKYDPEANSITANDNGSYWKGYLGYPLIAFLLLKGVIEYRQEDTEALRGIAWKDINTKFKNDFNKTIEHIHQKLKEKNINVQGLVKSVGEIYQQLKDKEFKKLGLTAKPPEGY